jgi:hypothetical protein
MLLGVIINDVAPQQSYLSAKWFKVIFLVADVFSLVLQAIGGRRPFAFTYYRLLT